MELCRDSHLSRQHRLGTRFSYAKYIYCISHSCNVGVFLHNNIIKFELIEDIFIICEWQTVWQVTICFGIWHKHMSTLFAVHTEISENLDLFRSRLSSLEYIFLIVRHFKSKDGKKFAESRAFFVLVFNCFARFFFAPLKINIQKMINR